MLDHGYIKNHLAIHNYESFGRNIIAEILEATIERVEERYFRSTCENKYSFLEWIYSQKNAIFPFF